ncbi:MAG TPA: hypothetical protein VFG79_13815 [Solirubrobacter sp.]|nr:hypothetical protein [Solirubrobacter sp.]
MDFAKTARNLAVADLALAFARDRVGAKLPGAKPKRRRPGMKALLLGGVAAGAAGVVLFKRERVAALLPGRSDEPAPPQPEVYTPPPVSNYDAAGPVANTATAVPVPPPYQSSSIDEREEEAAAAAEAGNIGGPVSDYAGPGLGEDARPEERPLAEAGQGEAEGQEQAEAELRAAAEPTAPGMSDEQRQIEEAIERADNPTEQIEAVEPADDSEPRTWSGR